MIENNLYKSWDSPQFLADFSAYRNDLSIFWKFRQRQIYGNLQYCLEKVVPYSNIVNEVGVGGGRSYSAFLAVLKKLRIKDCDYRGYDVSSQCIDYLNEYNGPLFKLSPVVNPLYRECDLLYFFDVLIHAEKPFEFLDDVSKSCRKYLVFQTPTRDRGDTEFDVSKSCRRQNNLWIPYIIWNVDQLVNELKKRGFTKILLIKSYKNLAGGGARFLPKEFYEPRIGSSRTVVLAIKDEGMSEELTLDPDLRDEVNLIKRIDRVVIPRSVRFLNWAYRKVVSS